MKPFIILFKDLLYGERDSMKRSTNNVILFLNINQGGHWVYDRDCDQYQDTQSKRSNKPYEIKYFR